MKIIHTADLHFDSKMETNLTKEMAKERKMEIRYSFQRLIEYANENDIKVILICGDMFDTANVSNSTRTFLVDLIKGNPQIDFLILKGNHDEYNLLLDEELANVKLFKNELTHFKYDDVNIYGFNMKSGGFSPANFELLSFDKNEKNILCLHGQISNNYSLSVDYCIPLNLLKNKNIDYLALGHIHSFNFGKIDERGIYAYSGILEPRGFDECGEKGFIEINVTDKIYTKFVPFSKREFKECEVDISKCDNASEILTSALESLKEENSGNFIKLKLVGDYDLGKDKDIAYLEKVLNDKFYFAKVMDCTTIKADYEKLQYDISLKGEFVRAVLSDTSLSESDKKTIIDYGIKALEKGEI